jgi:hypothetical protein
LRTEEKIPMSGRMYWVRADELPEKRAAQNGGRLFSAVEVAAYSLRL